MGSNGAYTELQGLTLVQFSAQLEIGGARRDSVARVKGVLGDVEGVLGVLCVSDTAQVELKSEGV